MEIKYFLSSDVNVDIKFNMVGIEGGERFLRSESFKSLRQNASSTLDCAAGTFELFVSSALYSQSHQLSPLTSSTYKTFNSNPCWNEWMSVCGKYRDLCPSSRLAFTVWILSSESDEPVPLGGTSISLFDEKNILRFGRQRLYLWRGKEGDGDLNCSTPFQRGDLGGLGRLEQTVQDFFQKPLPRVGWLDELLIRSIEDSDDKEFIESAGEEPMFLIVEFPSFRYPVVFNEKSCYPPMPDFASDAIYERDVAREMYDPGMEQSNPIEDKFHKLARSQRGIVDKDLKPKVSERNELAQIITSPNNHLTAAEKALLWRFRFTLTENKRALIKFLRCVDWSDAHESDEAVQLLSKWAKIDIADALGLLSSHFSNVDVRRHAVQRLENADNHQLEMYLLQLVQALRFESSHPSELSKFLVRRCAESVEMATSFHWYIVVEQESSSHGPLYTQVQNDFFRALQSRRQAGAEIAHMLELERSFVEKLVELGNITRSSRRDRVEKKIERLRSLLSEKGEMRQLCNLDEVVPMPVRPSVLVKGIIAEQSIVFRSALCPLGLMCTTVTPERQFHVMIKSGDDLRQDQLIIQMIHLMDEILKRVNLDLKLTPYRVLATSSTEGLIELVPNSKTLTWILGHHEKDIRRYLEENCPKASELPGILDTFVKSCAGYCVITYILGIGDRHLDNVLLDTTGHLFHIDFGYIFGRDPKPFPPPMKLCKEMVEAMGGSKSAQYHAFESYCCQAFNIFRKSADLILNLLSLMADSCVEELSGDLEKNLFKVQEKFRLDLSDEEAEQFFLKLVSDSVSALFPQVVEKIHKYWALYWR